MKRSIAWFAICARRSRQAMRNNIGKYAATIAWPVLVTALILVAWELSVRALGIRSIILPPPSAVFEAMAQRHDLLLAHLWPSLYLTVLGFLFSVIGGIFVAVLITYSAIVRKGFYPVIVVSQVIPKISIALVHRVVRDRNHVEPAAGLPGRVLSDDDQRGHGFRVDRRGYPPHGEHLHGLALADLLEDPHAQRFAVYLRRHEDFHHVGHHRRHRVGVRASPLMLNATQEGIGYLIKLAGGCWRRSVVPAVRQHGLGYMDPDLVATTAKTVQTYMGVTNAPSTQTLFTNKFVGTVKLTEAEWAEVEKRSEKYLPRKSS